MTIDLHKEYFACLALKHTPRLTGRVWKALFGHYDSAYAAVQDAASWVLLSPEVSGLAKLGQAVNREVWREKAEEEYKAVIQADMDVITWFDTRYPLRFRELPDPPAILYVQGDTSLLRNPGVAVVGARECTALGLESAGRISTQLSRIGITVVSGMALGIDRQAHLGGMRGIGSSIAVLGCGLDVDYPAGNRDVRLAMNKKGLVITEYGPGVGARGHHFPIRNRLISGLSLGVLVAEAAHRSGSLITARLAAEQGREVFALPGPIGQPTFTGCHRLIKQGASLVENGEDIVEILRYDFARELTDIPDPEPIDLTDVPDCEEIEEEALVCSRKPERSRDPATSSRPEKKRLSAVEREGMVLDEEEKRVMAVLEEKDKVHIDALGRKLEWASSKVSKVLIMLEMRGAVQQLPGMWYLAKEES